MVERPSPSSDPGASEGGLGRLAAAGQAPERTRHRHTPQVTGQDLGLFTLSAVSVASVNPLRHS